MKSLFLVFVLLLPATASAQVSVVKWADWASYGTAAVNPTIATVRAFQSADPKCALARLAISEAVGNGVSLVVKHFVHSSRPCLGCLSDGMPSGHTMNSAIGFSSGWKIGLAFTLGTAELRTDAHRHTPAQVAVGAALGITAEFIGQRALSCHE